MNILKLLTIAVLAISSGFGGAASTFAQQGDQLVTLCFRNRTIQVPFYLVNRYTANGATIGACPPVFDTTPSLLTFRKPLQRPSSKSTK